MNVRSIVVNRETYYVSADDNVRQVAYYMSERRIGAVSVLDGETVAGIISERDIMSRVVAKGLDAERTKVRDVMTRELLVAAPDDSNEDALRSERMQVDLSAKDEEIRWLNAYIHFVPPGREGGA